MRCSRVVHNPVFYDTTISPAHAISCLRWVILLESGGDHHELATEFDDCVPPFWHPGDQFRDLGGTLTDSGINRKDTWVSDVEMLLFLG